MANEQSASGSYQFQAEVRQLLDILTHSLYTHRDIFIRELISNAADALDKARFKSIKGEELVDAELDLNIKIDLDKDNKLFTISDTGIGMTKQELINNIGTIARSGTSEFVKQLAKEKNSDLNLIGRFGIGFYSVFMAGEKVEIITKSADKNEPSYIWTSDGQGEFEITDGPADAKRGTQIKVYLREDAADFAESWNVKSIIEKYSNFVPFPINLDGEQINTVSAIWREPKSSVKQDQYNEFYKFIAKQGDEPLTHLHFSADVPIQFNSLLFIPKSNMELMGFGRDDDGLHLFVKRVMVDSHDKELLPNYLRFVRGVVESDDLPLNISRETLQENPHHFKIRNTITSKLLSHLQDLAKKEAEQYNEFWKQHGRIFKEGYNDFGNKEKVADLFRFNSSKCETADELISLQTYIDRMPEHQEEIYFLSGPDKKTVQSNPVMEIFRAKDVEVLFCYDPLDEFALPGLMEFKGKKIISADQADLDNLNKLASVEPEKQDEEKEEKTDKKEIDKLARRIKDILGDKVEDVKISERLVDSPAILLGANKGMSAQMEKIMHMYNPDAAMSKKVMEINPKHGMIKKLLGIYQKDVQDPMLTKLVNNLFNSVALLDGSIENPNEMALALQELLSEATNLYTKE